MDPKLKGNKLCLICHQGKPGQKVFYSEGKYSYILCRKCGGAFLVPRPNVRQLIREVYTTNYFEKPDVGSAKKFIFSIKLYQDYPEWVERSSHIKKRLLDVGAGTPDFVLEMRRKGCEVYAQELSKHQAQKISRLIGKEKVFVGDFLKVKLPSNLFDTVCFWHVLEHLEDPLEALKKTNTFLKREGKIFIEVPNLESATLKLFGHYYDFWRIPEHLSYFSDKSLRKIFKRAGFKIQKIEYPLKYNSTFSLSVKNLATPLLGESLSEVLFYFSLPVSLLWTLLIAYFQKSEVIRVVAVKH